MGRLHYNRCTLFVTRAKQPSAVLAGALSLSHSTPLHHTDGRAPSLHHCVSRSPGQRARDVTAQTLHLYLSAPGAAKTRSALGTPNPTQPNPTGHESDVMVLEVGTAVGTRTTSTWAAGPAARRRSRGQVVSFALAPASSRRVRLRCRAMQQHEEEQERPPTVRAVTIPFADLRVIFPRC